jgi:hypothetical protein
LGAFLAEHRGGRGNHDIARRSPSAGRGVQGTAAQDTIGLFFIKLRKHPGQLMQLHHPSIAASG